MIALLLIAGCTATPTTLAAQHVHGGGPEEPHDHDHGPLHFSHPLIAESPSPDTKVRLDYFHADLTADEGTRQTLQFEGEYAFAPWVSAEVDVPYTFLDPDAEPATSRLDTVEVAVKYANFTFAEHGLLIGGGLELRLPTGNEDAGIGSNHVLEVAPYADFGYRVGQVELVGFGSLAIPTNGGDEEADREIGWNFSALYHVTPELESLIELDGTHVHGGDEDGFDGVNVTPGVKVRLFGNPAVKLGFGVSLPISSDREFHAMPVISLFWHI